MLSLEPAVTKPPATGGAITLTPIAAGFAPFQYSIPIFKLVGPGTIWLTTETGPFAEFPFSPEASIIVIAVDSVT